MLRDEVVRRKIYMSQLFISDRIKCSSGSWAMKKFRKDAFDY